MNGLRVLELGSLIGAPFCGTLMAEFGAEVIKVEDPKVGDSARYFGKVRDGSSLYFAFMARNKKCITMDLRIP
ncbi:MAG TPA: CoA transferase, partial [Thermodesulfobacteriota bacterium]|nr:CoA transferase [Thermodesulfobacteriota bacterium]